MSTNSAENTAKNVPQNCVLLLIRGHRKVGQKEGLHLWYGRDFLAPTPSVRQPLFETSDMINMINISSVLSNFCSKCAENRGNVNHVNHFPVFVSSECVRCVSYSIQREALKLRCLVRFLIVLFKTENLAKNKTTKFGLAMFGQTSFSAQFYRKIRKM